MIKTIIFDLDGVLIESKEIHYKALNAALPVDYRIGYEEHLSTYDGLPTKQKLELLSLTKNLPKELHAEIQKNKAKDTDLLNIEREMSEPEEDADIEKVEIEIEATSRHDTERRDSFMSFYFGIEDITSRCETANEEGEEWTSNAVRRRSIFMPKWLRARRVTNLQTFASKLDIRAERLVEWISYKHWRDWKNSFRNRPEMPSEEERVAIRAYTEEVRFFWSEGLGYREVANALHGSKMKKTDTSTCLENLAEGLYKTSRSCRDVVFRVQHSPPSKVGSLFGFPLHINPSVSSTSLINMLNVPRMAEGMAACANSNGNMCGSLMIMIHTTGRDIQHISSRRDEREVTIPPGSIWILLQPCMHRRTDGYDFGQVDRMLEITDIANTLRFRMKDYPLEEIENRFYKFADAQGAFFRHYHRSSDLGASALYRDTACPGGGIGKRYYRI